MAATGLSRAFDSVKRADQVLLWGLGLAAIAFLWTLAHLATRSLWWDELFTVALAGPDTPANETMDTIREDVHPPLYFLGERLWLGILNSSSEFAARAFNLIPYGLAIGAAWWGLKRRIEQPVAPWLVLFFTSFGFLWYLQEARMYAMMIAQAFCGCLMVLDYETQKYQRIKPGYVAFLAVVFVVLPLNHWFSLGFAGSLLIGLALWAWVEKRFQYVALFLSLGVALGLLGAGWILSNFSNTMGAAGGYGSHIYGGTLSFWGVRTTLTGILLYGVTLNPILILAMGYGAWRYLAMKRKPASLTIILLVSALLSLAIFAVSAISPMYQTRNFAWLVAPTTLLAAIGLQAAFDQAKLKRFQQAMAVVSILAINAFIGVMAPRFYPLEVDQWRAAGQYVSGQPGCHDAKIPVLADWISRADSPTSLKRSQRMYSYYGGGDPERMQLVLKREPISVDANSPCPVALWAAQIAPEAVEQLSRDMFDEAAGQMEIVQFKGQAVFLRAGTKTAQALNPAER